MESGWWTESEQQDFRGEEGQQGFHCKDNGRPEKGVSAGELHDSV